jgi:HAD superfamily hydrolase (TIGR01509 family)
VETRGILFDLDGLLVDSEILWSEADAAFFEARGIDPDPDELKTLLMGTTGEEAAHIIRKRYGLAESEETILADRQERVIRLYRERLDPRPGAEEVLARFDLPGWKRGLATASNRALVEAVFARLPWERRFDAVALSDDVPRGKPAPDLFLLAARRLGVEPASCVVVEDAPAGVAAARAAGMGSVAVPDPRFHRPEELPADLVLESLDELSVADALLLLERRS